MTAKKQRQLLIDTLVAVYPLIGRGFVQIGDVMASGKGHIESTLKAVGALETTLEPK